MTGDPFIEDTREEPIFWGEEELCSLCNCPLNAPPDPDARMGILDGCHVECIEYEKFVTKSRRDAAAGEFNDD